MAKQLIRRPVVNAPTSNSDNAQVSISPDGNWLLWFNSTTVGRLYKWDGTNYVEVAFNAGATIYHAAWTPDMAYLILTTSIAAQRTQLRSFNSTTGATAILSGLSTGSVDNSTILHFYGDYFVTCTTNANAASVRVLLLNRTTNVLTVVATYAITVIANTVYSIEPMENKRQIAIVQNASGTIYTSLLLFDAAGGTLTRSASRQSIPAGYGLGISESENFWHAVSPASGNSARAGTINAAGNDVTKYDVSVYPNPVANFPAYQTRFMFDDTAVFFGMGVAAADGKFDQYLKFNNGAFSANDGEIIQMSANVGPFKTTRTSGASSKSRTARAIWAFLHEGSNNPAVSVFVETIQNLEATLLAQGVMGDARSSMVVDLSARFFAQGIMGDAFVTTIEPAAIRFGGTGIMGDATFTTIGQHFINVAMGVMGDATLDIANTYFEALEAQGLMGDAILTTVEFTGTDILAIGPMGDATITFSPQWTFIEPVGLMGDAVVEIPNVYVPEMLAIAPMGDAVVEIPNVYVRSLFAQGIMGNATVQLTGSGVNLRAQGIMGDAVVEIPNVYVFELSAQGIMGEATVDINVPPTTVLVAQGLMGDAAIATNDEDFICRRRSMMIIQVI